MSTTLTKLRAKRIPGVTTPSAAKGYLGVMVSGSGVVKHYVQGPTKPGTHVDFNPGNLVEVVQIGLPVTELTDLQISLGVPADKLAPMLGISRATFHRRKGAGSKLNSAVSDRVVRFARLLGKTIKVFGGIEDAKQWLNSPQFGLGGAVPLEYARTEIGAREVENLLGRIEYGVYS